MILRDVIRRLRRTRLGTRLAVLSAALAAAVIGGTFVALSVQVRRSTHQLFADELSRNQRTLAALQAENRRRLVLTSALLAESPNLRSAMATYRVEQVDDKPVRADLTNTVEHELERLGRDLNAGALLATDERGRVFAGYVRGGENVRLPRGLGLATLPAVRNALDPAVVSARSETYLSGLEVGDAYYAVGVAPVILNGYTIGALVFGERVDSSLVASLRASFDGDVVASAGSHVIAATLAARDARDIAASSDATERSVTLGDEEYLAAVIPMGRTQLGTELRLTLLQPLTPTVDALATQLRRHFLLYGALAVALAALGAALLSRSLLRPLRAFIAIMHAGAEGKVVEQGFDAEDASQEIRTLEASYTRLMEALGQERRALERRGTELAAANEVLTDEIRGRERVEQALRDSEAQLRQSQKLEAIGTLAGGIAHDFNNLLTVISGFTQLAMGRLGRTHEVAADLKEVTDAAARAASLTHQLLAFSRKQVLQPRVLDLETTVRGMEEMLRRLIGSHIDLRVEHDGEPARIKADPSQLEQVLLNLVVNARDAMPDGGVMTLSTRHEMNPSAGGARCVTLRVTDTGVGMSNDVRERVFEPFYTTKETGKGTGLGLSTVYGVMAQSGGSIEVDSVVGKGSTFTVFFPFVSEAETAGSTTVDYEERGTGPVGSETILLVDDDDSIRRLAEQALVSYGYTVMVARNGIEALTLARTMPRLDVLITDIVMPQLSGPQLADRLTAKSPAPCVVYMTGWVNDATMKLELDADVTLLRKPFTPLELARTVRNALDGVGVPS